MKARELAELLMQTPDAEVVMEDACLAATMAEDDEVEEGRAKSYTTHGFQRVAGLEVGFCCIHEAPINWDMAFNVSPPEPASDGVPAVRVMGSNSEPVPPSRVRRRNGPWLMFEGG